MISFIKRSSYGKVRFYPDSPEAHAIIEITGRKCLNAGEVNRLAAAGFAVEVLSPSGPGEDTKEDV